MFVETIKNGKYRSVLLRESYRKDGKVLHRTVANLTGPPQEEIDAIDFALRNKKSLRSALGAPDAPAGRQGKSAGAVCAVLQIARELGIGRGAAVRVTLGYSISP